MLDEADRLLDLGFQAKLQTICDLLDGLSEGGQAAAAAARNGGGEEGAEELEEQEEDKSGRKRRQTVLLSATLHAQLSSLAAVSLHNPAAVGFTVSKVGGGRTGSVHICTGSVDICTGSVIWSQG